MALTFATVGGKITAALYNALVTFANANIPGIFPIVPGGSAGTGVLVGPAGVVTFTNATTVSLNQCFTTAYENYQIVVDVTNRTAAVALLMVLRTAGTDNTAAVYSAQRQGTTGTTATAPAQAINGVNWAIDGSALIGTFHSDISMFGPMLAAATGAQNNGVARSGTTIAGHNGWFDHSVATSYDGFTLSVGTGTITGTIRIYGLNNN